MGIRGRDVWEHLARENAEFYVATDKRFRQGPDEAFFQGGEREAAEILGLVAPWVERRQVALEFGAGVGRLAIPMSQHFERLLAVDVSPTMLVRLSENAAAAGLTNIECYEVEDSWDQAATADMAYSRLVFQHIEDMAEIERYVARISHALDSAGAAYLQFDTRPATLAYRVRNATPSRMLPRTHRKGIRRIRRARDELVRMLERVGLGVLDEIDPNQDENVFVVRRTP